MNRLTDGVLYLAREMSASVDEFRRDNQPQGAMLLEGMVSRGLVAEKLGRVALSPQGRRMHEDVAPEVEP